MAKRSRSDSASSSQSSFTQNALPVEVSKYAQLSPTSSRAGRVQQVVQCALPPHPTLSFYSYSDYDIHYRQAHENRCSECHKNFPTSHYLDLHIAENHDPLNEARKARGDKIYRCFLASCDKVCATPQKRRMHLVDKHVFPRNYDFFIVNNGLDGRASLLRSRHRRPARPDDQKNKAKFQNPTSESQRSISEGQQDEVSEEADSDSFESGDESDNEGGPTDGDAESSNGPKTRRKPSVTSRLNIRSDPLPRPSQSSADVNDLTVGMAALKFVPPSVRFGRGRGKGGLARK